MSQTDTLYPDLAKLGGLAPCLQETLSKIGSPLQVRTLDTAVEGAKKEIVSRFSTYARVEHAGRSSQVYIAAEKRLFLSDFWNRGVMLANASTPNLVKTATSIHRWIVGTVSISQLRDEFSFVEPVDSATVFEDGREVEWRWASYAKSIPRDFPQLTDFFEYALDAPELRRLFPFTSLGWFCFSRCTGYPYTRDCPSVISQRQIGSNRVIPHRYEVRLAGSLLGIGDGAEATRLVVQHLPEGCGPAVAGTAKDL